MAVQRHAILHIGTPKTGSTSIQTFLHNHRDTLLKHGIVFATSPGRRNHLALAVLGAGEDYTGTALTRAGGGGDAKSLGPRLQHDLAAEMAALGDNVHTVVFSSEQLSRLTSPEEVGRVRSLLAPHFETIRVLVYLRRQDELAVSQYSTSLRAGGETAPDILPPPGEKGSLFNFAALVEAYAATFGQAAIMPRIFDRTSLIGGDVVRDFLETCGVAGIDTGRPASNSGLRADVQEFARRFNVLVAERGLANRPRLGPSLQDAKFHGKARLPTQAEARAFLDRFRKSNDRLRAAYFPDRATLFTEDFSRYPETIDLDAISDTRVLRVALEVALDLAEELRSARLAALYRAGQDATKAGLLSKARRFYSRALEQEKDNKQVKQALLLLDQAQAESRGEPVQKTLRRGAPGAKARRQRKADAVGPAPSDDVAASPAPEAASPATTRQADRAERQAKRKAARQAA